jgi:hypothetical protein
MRPLMHTAWIINRRLLLQFSPWLALYLWMLVNAQSSGDTMVTAIVLVFFALLVTIIVTLQGLLLPVEEFLLSLPVSRSQLVRAKYLSSFLGLSAGLALPLLTGWIAHLVAPGRVPAMSPEVLGTGGLAAIFLAFGICFLLPFVYRLGPAKGLTISSLTLALLLAVSVAWKGRWGCIKALLDFSNRVLESRPFALSVLAGLALFGTASVAFSIWTYRRAGRS